MSDVDLHLSNVIEDDTTLESIKDRLKAGLRLWNNCERPIRVTNTYRGSSGGTVTVNITGEGTYIQFTPITENNCHIVSTSVTQNDASFIVSLTVTITQGGEYSIFYQLDSKTIAKSIVIGDFTYDNVEKSFML